MKLANKVAVITGAASGIGRGIAKRFAAEGAAVVIDYIGKPDRATAVMNEIIAAGGRAATCQADVSDPAQASALVAEAVKQFGRLDIAVNNAGIETKHDFVDFPIDEIRKIINVNLIGPMLVAQAAARQLIAQKTGGRLINISSVHEDLPMPTNTPYCASKGGLRMFMRSLSVELAAHQITVNNIGPGAVYTPIDADIQAHPEIEKQLMAEIPLGRWGQPEEIASLATFLASEEAGYITGSTYFIDGGMLRQAGSL